MATPRSIVTYPTLCSDCSDTVSVFCLILNEVPFVIIIHLHLNMITAYCNGLSKKNVRNLMYFEEYFVRLFDRVCQSLEEQSYK